MRRSNHASLLNDVVQKAPKTALSETAFLHWLNEYTRAQWVDGRVTILPFGGSAQSDLQGWLQCVLGMFVEEREIGRVVGSRFLFRLPTPISFRMASLFFVSRERMHLFRNYFFDGPPDLVVQIRHPKQRPEVRQEIFTACQASGVREFWSIDPHAQEVAFFTLENGRMLRIPETKGKCSSRVLPKLHVTTDWFWRLPKISTTLREIL